MLDTHNNNNSDNNNRNNNNKNQQEQQRLMLMSTYKRSNGSNGSKAGPRTIYIQIHIYIYKWNGTEEIMQLLPQGA